MSERDAAARSLLVDWILAYQAAVIAMAERGQHWTVARQTEEHNAWSQAAKKLWETGGALTEARQKLVKLFDGDSTRVDRIVEARRLVA